MFSDKFAVLIAPKAHFRPVVAFPIPIVDFVLFGYYEITEHLWRHGRKKDSEINFGSELSDTSYITLEKK